MLGERLRLARLRRRIPSVEMASRIGVSRVTYRSLEAGEPSVSLAVLVRALSVLGMERDLELVAANDELGRKLEDVRLTRPRRASSATRS